MLAAHQPALVESRPANGRHTLGAGHGHWRLGRGVGCLVSLVLVVCGGVGLSGTARVLGQSNSTIEHTPTKLQFSGLAIEDRAFLSAPSKSDPERLVNILVGPKRVILPAKSATAQPDVKPAPVSFELRQSVVSRQAASIVAIGSTLQTLPFNEYGRRRVFVDTNQGPKWLLQGITKLDPSYVQVQGVDMAGKGLFEFPYDFRIATAAIPGDLLVKMLKNAIDDLGDYQQREKVVEFLITAERYNEAIRELNQLQVDFGDLDTERFDVLKTRLVNASARLVLNELDRRWEAGQWLTVRNILENIDPQNISPETLVDVRTRLRDIDEAAVELERLRAAVQATFAAYRMGRDLGEALTVDLQGLEEEIVRDLNPNNRDRLATYVLRNNAAGLQPENALSLLISGWLMGAADAFDNATVAVTLIESRALLIRYLQSTDPAERMEIIERLRQIEAGSPRYLAALARLILPWQPAPPPEAGSQGFVRLRLDDVPGQPEYLVQLPPEYDPYKKYPVVIALCDIQSSPQFEIEWWDGDLSSADGYRTGQASRQGYIVVAPDWRKPQEYEYSYDPYAALVATRSLRECLRRFSVDADRVFLAGHGVGGEVAWDIGLAHPDLWAGVVPISALADRYIPFYTSNSRKHLPMYFVLGENHLPPSRGMIGKFDKREGIFQEMAGSIHYNFIVVKYVGRRSEHFLEEIIGIFDWMRNRRRSFAAADFEVTTMRPWDRHFWWLQLNDVPDNLVVAPQAWNVASERKSLTVSAEINTTQTGQTRFSVRNGGDSITLWVSPRWANMDDEILFAWNRGRNDKASMSPSRTVILEDLRTRSDTLNPFWAWARYDKGWTTSNELP